MMHYIRNNLRAKTATNATVRRNHPQGRDLETLISSDGPSRRCVDFEPTVLTGGKFPSLHTYLLIPPFRTTDMERRTTGLTVSSVSGPNFAQPLSCVNREVELGSHVVS